MKIAVVGCGAVGSFYGAKLARAGHEVHFLLRSDYDVVQRQGVLVRSPQGDFRVHPRCARRPESIGVCEVVLIALKTTANDQFARLLPPLVGAATAVLTLQNGLGNEEKVAELVPTRQILGGLCFVCLNRLEPGLIHHIDHGLVVLGEFNRPAVERTHGLAEAFRHAGISCSVSEDLARTHWEKLTWNIPFNGLGVAATAGLQAVLRGSLTPGHAFLGCFSTDRLLADERWTKVVRELMFEVISTARALGHSLPDALADKQIDRTRSMGPYKASTLIDFERKQPLEMQSLFLEPLRHAKWVGIKVPRLEALCRVLQELDPAATKP